MAARRFDRRTLVTSTAVALGLGTPAGVAMRDRAGRQAPSVSVIGDDDWQIALIDADNRRLLAVLGEPPDTVFAGLSWMMGLFRQRLDVLIATGSTVERVWPTLRARWNAASAIAVDEEGLRLTVTQRRGSTFSFELGDLSLVVESRRGGAWQAGDIDSRIAWSVTAERATHRLVLAPTFEDCADAAGHAAVIIAPVGDPTRVLARLRPAAIAANADVFGGTEPWTALEVTTARIVRVFPDDIARFTMRHDGVSLPDWAATR